MKSLFDSLDEFKPKKKSVELYEIVTVGPYPTSDFFRKLISKYKPKKIHLIVDQGWRNAYLDEIESISKKIILNILHCKPLNSSGLVHAKLYFLIWRWKNNNKFSYRRILFFGSPNASLQGFELHAEVFCSVMMKHLKKNQQENIKKYFETLKNGKSVIRQIIRNRDLFSLWLPKIEIVNKKDQDFDAWIRSGRLCHKFDHDSSFGKLIVKLKRKLPRTVHETVLGKGGFVRKTQKDILLRKYLGNQLSSKGPKWRSQFFTESWYGHWTSNDCFEDANKSLILSKKDQKPIYFTAPNSKTRQKNITTILSADSKNKDKWLIEFIKELEKSFFALEKRGKNPNKYFKTLNGNLDVTHYKNLSRKKLKKDQLKAKVQYFQKIYISGYVFPPVPPLGPAYNSFVIDLCDSLLKSILSGKITNKFAQTIKKSFKENDIQQCNDGNDLYTLIKDNWEDKKGKIMSYYKN